MTRVVAGVARLTGTLRRRAQSAADLHLRPLLDVGAWDRLRRVVFGIEEGLARLAAPLLLGAAPAVAAREARIALVDDATAPAFEAYLVAHGQQVAWLRELRLRRQARVLAAWWRGGVLGHVVLVPRAALPDGRAAVQLVNFHVAPALRGKGLGQRLLAAFREQARSSGASIIRLTVNQGDARAVAFYRKAGFVATNVLPTRALPGRIVLEGSI